MASNDGRATPPAPNLFLRGLLIRALLLGLLTAGMNLLVNPFGSYGTHLFEPITLSTRRPKLVLHAQRRPAPEIVLLGSSRSFAFEPAYVEARTSRPTFNAAVHAASTRDYLNLARCLARRDTFPSLLIVGLGVEQMIVESSQPVERPDPLAKCASVDEESIVATLRNYRGLLTMEEAWASLRVLALDLRGRPAPRFTFAADGMVIGSETGTLEQAVANALTGNWQPANFNVGDLGPANVCQFRQLLELCREHGAKMIVYLPPYHPRATARYVSESRFSALHGRLLGQLASWAEQYDVQFHDFTEISRFRGSEHMFVDASHPTKEAFRLMVDVMLGEMT